MCCSDLLWEQNWLTAPAVVSLDPPPHFPWDHVSGGCFQPRTGHGDNSYVGPSQGIAGRLQWVTKARRLSSGLGRAFLELLWSLRPVYPTVLSSLSHSQLSDLHHGMKVPPPFSVPSPFVLHRHFPQHMSYSVLSRCLFLRGPELTRLLSHPVRCRVRSRGHTHSPSRSLQSCRRDWQGNLPSTFT